MLDLINYTEAQIPAICGEPAYMLEELSSYGEKPIIFDNHNNVPNFSLVVLYSEENDTFTVLVNYPNGKSCSVYAEEPTP